jgi:hypothetical protein
MVNIAKHQRNAIQNQNVLLPHFVEKSYFPKDKKLKSIDEDEEKRDTSNTAKGM